ncbi:MAG: metallophosphoesterase [Bdellovibrionota bacterium]
MPADYLRNALLTGLEWLVLYHLWEAFPRLRKIPRSFWYALAGLLLAGNFWFRAIKRSFHATPGSPEIWSFLYRLYVTSYFVVGAAAAGAGFLLLAHYGLKWWEKRREIAPASTSPAGGGGREAALTRRAFLSYGVAGGVTLAAGSSGWAVATSNEKDVRVRTIRVPVPEEHRHLVGLRIAQITDIHVGPFLGEKELEGMMRLVMKERPDAIVHTGDHWNSEPEYEKEGENPLSLLEAPHGLYAVPGNHDRYFGVEKFSALFEKNGIQVLRARNVEVPGVPGLVLWGINDPAEKLPKSFPEVEELGKQLDPSKYNLLLTHRPEAFREASQAGFQLSLAGHTHGGQVHLNLAGIDISPAKLFHPYDWGLFKRENSHLYVSSGLGYAGPPVRSFCPPEVAVIEFVRAGDGDKAQKG